MRKAFDLILSKFPDHRTRIIELYNTDEDFRILCEDYLTSVQTLEECRQNVIKDREFENEFLEVNPDLEKEIGHNSQFIFIHHLFLSTISRQAKDNHPDFPKFR